MGAHANFNKVNIVIPLLLLILLIPSLYAEDFPRLSYRNVSWNGDIDSPTYGHMPQIKDVDKEQLLRIKAISNEIRKGNAQSFPQMIEIMKTTDCSLVVAECLESFSEMPILCKGHLNTILSLEHSDNPIIKRSFAITVKVLLGNSAFPILFRMYFSEVNSQRSSPMDDLWGVKANILNSLLKLDYSFVPVFPIVPICDYKHESVLRRVLSDIFVFSSIGCLITVPNFRRQY